MMKKLLYIFFLTIIFSCTSTGSIDSKYAEDLIPIDPAVEYGVLENGLEYFIRHNSEPDNRIVLRLVINAGSILEDEDQLGLAHLIEHLAFNGTANFEKHEIINYLESTGMKFGADTNAHTGFDETVYKINIPADDPSMLQTGLEILKEWAFEITFEDEEIDKERGVVVEEWRSGRGADARMRDKYFPVLFSESQYGVRMPIGDMDIVRNSSYDTIKRFYKDWYRPNLMAVVVVGQVDHASVKTQIEDIFGSYDNGSNPRQRKEFLVPDNSTRLYSIVSDSEAVTTSLQIVYKYDSVRNNTVGEYRTSINKILHNMMFSQRLDELTNQSEPPYLFAFTGVADFVRTKSAFFMGAVTAESGLVPAFRTILEENERFMRFGFTESELQRAKNEVLSSIDAAFKEKDKTESVYFAGELTNYFLNGTPGPGIDWEWKMIQSIIPEISLEEVVGIGKNLRSDIKPVIIVTGPEKASVSYPSAESLDDMFNAVAEADIEKYKDNISGLKLMDIVPQPGSVVEELHDEAADFYIWNLSNNSKVIFKNTDYKNNELLFSAFSPGGTSLVDDSEYFSSTLASELIESSGLGKLDNIALGKILTGKVVSIGPYIGALHEGFSGSSAPEDSETLFQLLNLYFTDIRRTDVGFNSFMNRTKGFLENRENMPEVVFEDAVMAALYDNHFRSQALTVSVLEGVEKTVVYDIFKERFTNPADFIFFFIGNIPENFKKLVETYIASIPEEGEKENWVDRDLSIVKGAHEIEVYAGIEKKSSVVIIFSGSYKWTLENNTALYALRDFLDIRLREEVRENSGGTYGVNVVASAIKFPKEEFIFSINFSCDPDRVEELSNVALRVIDEVRQSPASENNVLKIKEGFRRSYEESIRENSYWLALLESVYFYDLKSSYLLDKPARTEAVSAAMIMDAAVKYLDTDNYFKAVLYPEN